MGLFKNLGTEDLEKAQDRLGGFSVLETDVYTGKIKAAYAGESQNGAMSVSFIFDFGGREYRETYWVTNRNKENFFRNQQDQTKKIPLPGFTIVNDICLVTTDSPLSEQDTEDKVMNMWDPESKKELPKSVKMLTGLLGKEVSVGIFKQLENKSDKVGEEYVPNADTREVNVTDKIFHYPTNMTVAEAQQGQQEAKFHGLWLDKNKGTVKDKRTIKDGQAAPQGGKSGRPGGPPQAGGAAAPKTSSLFGS